MKMFVGKTAYTLGILIASILYGLGVGSPAYAQVEVHDADSIQSTDDIYKLLDDNNTKLGGNAIDQFNNEWTPPTITDANVLPDAADLSCYGPPNVCTKEQLSAIDDWSKQAYAAQLANAQRLLATASNQSTSISSDTEIMTQLAASASSASTPMAAQDAANAILLAQNAQLLEIRALLAAQQNATAIRDQVDAYDRQTALAKRRALNGCPSWGCSNSSMF